MASTTPSKAQWILGLTNDALSPSSRPSSTFAPTLQTSPASNGRGSSAVKLLDTSLKTRSSSSRPRSALPPRAHLGSRQSSEITRPNVASFHADSRANQDMMIDPRHTPELRRRQDVENLLDSGLGGSLHTSRDWTGDLPYMPSIVGHRKQEEKARHSSQGSDEFLALPPMPSIKEPIMVKKKTSMISLAMRSRPSRSSLSCMQPPSDDTVLASRIPSPRSAHAFSLDVEGNNGVKNIPSFGSLKTTSSNPSRRLTRPEMSSRLESAIGKGLPPVDPYVDAFGPRTPPTANICAREKPCAGSLMANPTYVSSPSWRSPRARSDLNVPSTTVDTLGNNDIYTGRVMDSGATSKYQVSMGENQDGQRIEISALGDTRQFPVIHALQTDEKRRRPSRLLQSTATSVESLRGEVIICHAKKASVTSAGQAKTIHHARRSSSLESPSASLTSATLSFRYSDRNSMKAPTAPSTPDETQTSWFFSSASDSSSFSTPKHGGSPPPVQSSPVHHITLSQDSANTVVAAPEASKPTLVNGGQHDLHVITELTPEEALLITQLRRKRISAAVTQAEERMTEKVTENDDRDHTMPTSIPSTPFSEVSALFSSPSSLHLEGLNPLDHHQPHQSRPKRIHSPVADLLLSRSPSRVPSSARLADPNIIVEEEADALERDTRGEFRELNTARSASYHRSSSLRSSGPTRMSSLRVREKVSRSSFSNDRSGHIRSYWEYTTTDANSNVFANTPPSANTNRVSDMSATPSTTTTTLTARGSVRSTRTPIYLDTTLDARLDAARKDVSERRSREAAQLGKTERRSAIFGGLGEKLARSSISSLGGVRVLDGGVESSARGSSTSCF